MSSVAGLTHQRYYVEENYRRLRSFPLFQLRDNHHDSSLRSLYRLYDAICVNEEGYVMLESDYFWRLAQSQGCPDPKDPNPTRYAVLAEATVGAQLEDDSWSLPRWWCDEQETG